MPGFDGTGPWGRGPMTGGGRGFCNPVGRGSGCFGRSGGRGFRRGGGQGFGPGRGFGRGYWGQAYYDAPYTDSPWAANPYDSPISRDQEIDFLQNQAQAIKKDLEDIEARIGELQQKES